jgi:hypothetical protein
MADPADPRHPVNVIDYEFSHEPSVMDKFKCPDITVELNIGQQYREHIPKVLNITEHNTNYLVMSGHGAQTNWHRDHTGTAVMYGLGMGTKHVFGVRPTENNKEIFDSWNQTATRKYDQSLSSHITPRLYFRIFSLFFLNITFVCFVSFCIVL